MTRRAGPLPALLVPALALPALALVLLAPPADAQAATPVASPWPAHFSVNDSAPVGVVVSGLAPALGTQPFTVLEFLLPPGSRLATVPAAPANWSVTSSWLTEDPPRLEYTHRVPDVDNAVNFTMTVDSLPCSSKNESLTWTIRGYRAGVATPETFTGTHRCDKKAPESLSLFTEEATTAQAGVDLTLLRDDSPIVQTARLTAPNGSAVVVTASGPRLTLPFDANVTGRWTYHVEAGDHAGNGARFPASGTNAFTVRDVTLPTVQLTAPATAEAGRAWYAFHNASDNHVLADLTLAWNATGGPVTTLTVKGATQTQLPAVADWKKNVTLTLTASDAAGNTKQATALVQFADTEAPTVSATFPAPNAAGWHASALVVNLAAHDNGSPRLVVNHSLFTRHPDGTTVITHGNGTDNGLASLTLAGPAEHTLHFAARDDLGHAASAQTRTIRIDPAAPAVSIENLTAGWRTQPLWLTLRATGTHSGAPTTSWTVDGQTQAQPSRRFAQDGVHAIAATATSPAGVAAQANGALRLDQTPPTLDLGMTSGGAQGGFHRGWVRFAPSASDATSGVASLSVSLDNQTRALPLNVTAEGPHQLDVTVTDNAGNVLRRTERFHVDATAPAVALTANGTGDSGVRNHSALLQATATDANGATLACALDGLAVTLPHTVTTDGDHLLACTATDPAGNTATPVLLAFRVDAAPPVLPAHRDLGPVAAMNVSLVLADASSVATVEARFETGSDVRHVEPWRNGTLWVVDSSGLPDGHHNLSVRATDVHGRATAWTRVLAFDLLSFAPSATFKTPPSTYAGHHAPVSISWTMPEHRVPLEMLLRLDGGAETVVTSPYVLEAEGLHHLSFRTRDALGNLGAPFDLDVRVLASAPPFSGNGGTGTGSGSTGTGGSAVANRAPILGSVSLVLEGDRAVAATRGVEDPDGDPVTLSYAWRVDGATVAGQQAASLRVTPGQRVQVTVTPSDGKLQGAPVDSAVLTVPASERPVARFGLSGFAAAGEKLTFDASASRLAITYRWTFSDGGTDEGVRVEHVFATAGDAWAELVVLGAEGASASLRRNFTLDAAPEPTGTFRHAASNGVTYVLEGHGANLTVERELPGPAFLVRDPDVLLLWTPDAGLVDKVREISATPGESRYATRAQVTPLAFAAEGWTLVTLADPHPDLALEAVSGPDGAPAVWWRDGQTVHALVRDGSLELRHALPALVLKVEKQETAEGAWSVTLTATGGGPLASLRLTDGAETLAEGTARTLTTTVRPEGSATYRATAVSADGQEASEEILFTADGTPGERNETDRPGDDDKSPVPGPGLALLLGAALVAIASFRRRRC